MNDLDVINEIFFQKVTNFITEMTEFVSVSLQLFEKHQNVHKELHQHILSHQEYLAKYTKILGSCQGFIKDHEQRLINVENAVRKLANGEVGINAVKYN